MAARRGSRSSAPPTRDPGDAAQLIDHRRAAAARTWRQRRRRRQAEQLAAAARSGSSRRAGSASSAAWITSWWGMNVWTSSRPPRRRGPSSRAALVEQRHRLLGGAVPRREQLAVEVEEGDDVGAVDAVEHRLGADVDVGVGAGRSDRMPVTATTGRPAAASSSSRRRVTPGRRLAKPEPPHSLAHRRALGCRSGAQRASSRSSPRPTAPSHRVQRSSARQVRQARMRARPVVLCTHTTRTPGVRSSRINADDSSDVLHGSSSLRSTTSTIGHPARSSSTGSRASVPPTAATPATLGHGDVASTAAPTRRARSTSDVAGVPGGRPLLLQRLVVLVDHDGGAQARARRPRGRRAPMTTSTPAAAAPTVAARPRPRARGARAPPPSPRPGPPSASRRASDRAARRRRSRRAATSPAAASARPRPPASTSAAAVRDRRARSPRPTRCDAAAATRHVRRRARRDEERAQPAGRPAHRRPRGELDQLRSRARATRQRATRLQPFRRQPPARGSSAITQPRTRRPCSGTRTIVPTASGPRNGVRDGVVELLVEPGDVGDRTADAYRRRVTRAAPTPPGLQPDGGLEVVEAAWCAPT